MNNDRKSLELAAKAAGIAYTWEQEGYAYGSVGVVPNGWRRCWDPRSEDTTDAFELAVDLMLRIDHSGHAVYVGMSGDDEGYLAVEPMTPSIPRSEATRRAIFRAAVEIGKEMK